MQVEVVVAVVAITSTSIITRTTTTANRVPRISMFSNLYLRPPREPLNMWYPITELPSINLLETLMHSIRMEGSMSLELLASAAEVAAVIVGLLPPTSVLTIIFINMVVTRRWLPYRAIPILVKTDTIIIIISSITTTTTNITILALHCPTDTTIVLRFPQAMPQMRLCRVLPLRALL